MASRLSSWAGWRRVCASTGQTEQINLCIVQGEINEMINIYKERGMSEEDATEIFTLLANKYADFFTRMMMSDEHEMEIPDEDENPYKSGMYTCSALVTI